MPYAQHYFIYNEAQINFFVHFCSQYAKHGLDICRHDRPYSGMSALSPHAIRKTVRRRKGWPRAAPEGGGRRRSGKVPRGAANDVDGRFPVRQDGFPHRVRRCGEAGVRRVIFVHVPAQRQPVQHDGFP